jgi:uncharacterized protein (DUF488 family)
MEIYTTGFAGKTAAVFFEQLVKASVKQVVDVRLKPNVQLSAFARGMDLPFLLERLSGATYAHVPLLAPTKELLSDYRKKRIDWPEYERRYIALLDARNVANVLDKELFSVRSALLCSEATAAKCHRRLAAEYLKSHWPDVVVVHL